MKKTVLTFGLISGAISTSMVLLMMPFIDRIGFDRGEILGYTTIVLSFLLVFAGVRSYRDNVQGGTITFKQGFIVGLLITLVSCACYVLTWEILYFGFGFMHDFTDKYAAYMVERAKASGASPEAVQQQIQETARFKELYENPLINAAMTFTEPFPVGLVITLISAAILRKKNRSPAPGAASLVS
jgi:Protein of unknown function (DUF4199)